MAAKTLLTETAYSRSTYYIYLFLNRSFLFPYYYNLFNYDSIMIKYAIIMKPLRPYTFIYFYLIVILLLSSLHQVKSFVFFLC